MKNYDYQFTSHGNHDECYTPPYVVEAIVPYLPYGRTIWCPFDKDYSPFVQVLQKHGFDVVRSHIDDGQDFYKYEPKHWDLIVSNPPFTGKKDIFKRALSFGKPFALLMTVTWLNDAAPVDVFNRRDLQLYMFRDRVKYVNPDGSEIGNVINFKSAFFCKGLLPKQIIMEPSAKANQDIPNFDITYTPWGTTKINLDWDPWHPDSSF